MYMCIHIYIYIYMCGRHKSRARCVKNKRYHVLYSDAIALSLAYQVQYTALPNSDVVDKRFYYFHD